MFATASLSYPSPSTYKTILLTNRPPLVAFGMEFLYGPYTSQAEAEALSIEQEIEKKLNQLKSEQNFQLLYESFGGEFITDAVQRTINGERKWWRLINCASYHIRKDEVGSRREPVSQVDKGMFDTQMKEKGFTRYSNPNK